MILLQQRLQHGTGLGAILREHVALTDTIGTFPASKRGLVKSYVADEIEGIEVFTHFLGKEIEGETFVFEFLDDGLFPLGPIIAVTQLLPG